MKFNQIADGQQFEYQGVVYTRSGPIMATDSDGRSKMIPRSANVRPISTAAEVKTAAPQKKIPVDKAISAFEDFNTHLDHCLQNQTDETGVVNIEAIQQCMTSARQVFLQTLQN